MGKIITSIILFCVGLHIYYEGVFHIRILIFFFEMLSEPHPGHQSTSAAVMNLHLV